MKAEYIAPRACYNCIEKDKSWEITGECSACRAKHTTVVDVIATGVGESRNMAIIHISEEEYRLVPSWTLKPMVEVQ